MIIKNVKNKADNRTIKVVGSGCRKCNELEANVRAALEQLGIEMRIEHVTDINVIGAYGIMTTPALFIDEKVVSYGKILKVQEVIKLLQEIIL